MSLLGKLGPFNATHVSRLTTLAVVMSLIWRTFSNWTAHMYRAARYLENDLDMRNATACMKRSYKVRNTLRIERNCFFGDVNATVSGCELDPTLEQAEAVSCHVCDNEDFCNRSIQLKAWPQYLAIIIFAFTAKFLNWLS
ncbi:unnamed protein product [Ceratitis capitata]|uniref:(Mediterranean fruit fly) hypothetical protein n=1 Tax=Ceratitis capitata TaxID=7213 RepID=A0A811UMB1_CERCA|nr:unnamed protein product [Ceratitis capitata]